MYNFNLSTSSLWLCLFSNSSCFTAFGGLAFEIVAFISYVRDGGLGYSTPLIWENSWINSLSLFLCLCFSLSRTHTASLKKENNKKREGKFKKKRHITRQNWKEVLSWVKRYTWKVRKQKLVNKKVLWHMNYISMVLWGPEDRLIIWGFCLFVCLFSSHTDTNFIDLRPSSE